MLEVMKVLNMVLAFLVELAALAGYAYWGFQTPENTIWKFVAGLGLPLLFIIIWSQIFAPKAPFRLEYPWLFIGKLIILLGGAVLLYLTGREVWGLVLGGLVILNLVLGWLWGTDKKVAA